MRYYDYEWELHPRALVFDRELDTDKLGWQQGDLFKFVIDEDGRTALRKIDPLEKFVRGIE